MEFEQFCSSSRVVIVAGKGGVGKTTVSAALALAAARTGLRVLVVEVEGKSGFAAMFDRPPLGYEETEVAPGLWARTLTADEALVEWLEARGMKRISRRLAHSGALDVVATAVPGMKDILLLGKVKGLEQSAGRPDLIVVDGPAAGHATTMLHSPHGLLDAVRVGPISQQAAEVTAMLADPSRCQVLLVTLPEETPVNELVDTAYAMEDRVGIALGPVVVNGCYDDLELDGPVTPDTVRRDAERLDRFVGEQEAADLAHAGEFRRSRHDLQLAQADRLAQRLPLPQLRLPFLFTADLGPAEIGRLADALVDAVAAVPAPVEVG